MRRIFTIVGILLLAVLAQAEESWLGFYIQGQKVGYVRISSDPDPKNPSLILRQSDMVVDASMLGQPLKINVKAWSWVDKAGRLVKTRQRMDSSGRINDVTADFTDKNIHAVMVTSGDKSETDIPVPAGAKILDDPVTDFVLNPVVNQTKETEAYIFAAESLSLQKITLRNLGPTKLDDKGKKIDALHIFVDDPRAATDVYLSAKGDLIKATGPLGMEYRPEPKDVALDISSAGKGDIALASSIPVKGIVDMGAKSMTYRVTGHDISRIPQDASQKVTKDGDAYVLTVKPVVPAGPGGTIKDAAAKMPDWTKSEPRIPSDSPRFKQLAAKIIKGEDHVLAAGQLLRQYVFQTMLVDAGIGVMRDANEILDSKTGVCRDYAVLLGTLTRAAGIATRFISGIVYTGQDFLYHAWIEVYDGKEWVALDSTRPQSNITPGHIKTAQGTVGEGISGFLLDGAKIEVLKGE